jgi:hypothetical protein
MRKGPQNLLEGSTVLVSCTFALVKRAGGTVPRLDSIFAPEACRAFAAGKEREL